jgi:hypothetical protein
LRISVSNAELAPEPLDLTIVTAAAFAVTTPRGDRVVWAAEITEQTATLLILEHAFAINDVNAAGRYQINIQLTVPDGVRRAGPTSLQVVE